LFENCVPILAVDFDGTITKGDFIDLDDPKALAEGAAKIINGWYNDGCIITIWSCRSPLDGTMFKADKFLGEHGIKYHYLNANVPWLPWVDSRKIFAHIYIDDKNLGGFPGWDEADKIVRSHPQYPKKGLRIADRSK